MSVIPAKALEHHIAVLGKTGAGKSYAAQGVVEHLIEHRARVCVIDPTDRYWGLRLLADGKSPSGYEVAIFGGAHADLPLGSTHGAAIAEIVGTTTTPAILSTRLMTVGERTRFFTDFAETLLRKNEGALHLIVDEAHLFAPQTRVASVESGKMLHAANNLVSLGRGIGLRIMLLSQRPAKLHKDSLTQVETMIALRLIAPQDRNAIREWVREWADEETGAEMMASLPSLPTGTGWLWAPELEILRKVSFPEISTFDSGRPPKPGAKGPVLNPIDLAAVRGKLEIVAKDAVESDPKRLKARVAELERELAKKPAAAAPDPAVIERARADALADGIEIGRAEGRAMALREAMEALREMGEAASGVVISRPLPRPAAPREAAGNHPAPPRPAKANGAAPPTSLPKGERAILIAVAQHREGVTREQLSVLTGYKRSSRDTYLQRLRERQAVEYRGERILVTDAGVAALGSDYEPLPTGAALREHWLSRLPEGERRILELLIACYPDEAERSWLDDRTGYKRSSRDTYLQRLTSRRLVIAVDRGRVRASEDLF